MRKLLFKDGAFVNVVLAGDDWEPPAGHEVAADDGRAFGEVKARPISDFEALKAVLIAKGVIVQADLDAAKAAK